MNVKGKDLGESELYTGLEFATELQVLEGHAVVLYFSRS